MSIELWYHLTISSSITPFSSCHQNFPVSGSFLMSWFFASSGLLIKIVWLSWVWLELNLIHTFINMLAAWRKSYHKPRQHIKKQSHLFADKCLYFQSYGFSCSHIRLWELDHKEGWALKNWCFRIVVLEKTLESPLDSKEIKPVNLKGNQPWIFSGRTDAEVEAPIPWPPDANCWLTEKDLDAGKDWGQEKWVTNKEMVGWCHWLNGHGFEQTRRQWIIGKPGEQHCSLDYYKYFLISLLWPLRYIHHLKVDISTWDFV